MQSEERKSWRRLLLGAGLVAAVGFAGTGCGDEDPSNPQIVNPDDKKDDKKDDD